MIKVNGFIPTKGIYLCYFMPFASNIDEPNLALAFGRVKGTCLIND